MIMRIKRKTKDDCKQCCHSGRKASSSKQQQPKKKNKGKKVLSAAEKKCPAYARVVVDGHGDHIGGWVPPSSPYGLLQEEHSFDHWRVLVICILLNKTPGHKVRRILGDFFELCPTAEVAKDVAAAQLEALIQPLGFSKARVKTIKRFSIEYLNPNWTYITELYGINKYAADAYAIFCTGKLKDVKPSDHKLVDYWRFVKKRMTS